MAWLRSLLRTLCTAVPRGIALFLGCFTLFNVVGELRSPGFDANLWWISLPIRWYWLEQPVLLWSAGCFIWFGTHRRLARTVNGFFLLTFGGLVGVSIWNAAGYYHLLSEGQIQSLSPAPFSAIVALSLGLVVLETWRTPSERPSTTWRDGLAVAITCVACGFLFPLAQMICFGVTDYRRHADVIVVFGAKVYEDGHLSSILEERVRTGCELYHEGLAGEILFSGGPGLGDVHEAERMRQRALELGLPPNAMYVDLNGIDTESTVINTLKMAQSQKWNRILAVSQPFHLPRIKLAFHRHGSEVYTVPAKRMYTFAYMPYFMLREVAAWWVYYLRPLS